MRIVRNLYRAKIILVCTALSALIGLIFTLFMRGGLRYVGCALLMNTATGCFAIAFFRRLRISKWFKLLGFAIGVGIKVLLYTLFPVEKDVNPVFPAFCVCAGLVGFLAMWLTRLTLAKSSSYLGVYFAVLPVAVLPAFLLSNLSWLLGFILVGGIIVSGICLVSMITEDPYVPQVNQSYTFTLPDGQVLYNQGGRRYSDSAGVLYELSANGKVLREV